MEKLLLADLSASGNLLPYYWSPRRFSTALRALISLLCMMVMEIPLFPALRFFRSDGYRHPDPLALIVDDVGEVIHIQTTGCNVCGDQ
jgi:hypothetical protein